jgi:hypothetical protein
MKQVEQRGTVCPARPRHGRNRSLDMQAIAPLEDYARHKFVALDHAQGASAWQKKVARYLPRDPRSDIEVRAIDDRADAR